MVTKVRMAEKKERTKLINRKSSSVAEIMPEDLGVTVEKNLLLH